MLSSLVLTSLLAGQAIGIEAVATRAESGRLTVDVTTTAPVPRDAAAVKLRHGKVALYIDGGQVLPGKESFSAGDRVVKALARPKYAKLEIPLADGVECGGPAEIEPTAGGLRAAIKCGARVDKAAARDEDREAEELLARRRSEKAPAAPEPVRAEPARAAAPSAPARAVAEVAPRDPVKPQPVALPAPPAAPPVAAPPPGPSLSGVLLPALALAAMAVAAVVLGRKRVRGTKTIQILESVALGPKRSLVLAKVGGETIVLGSSEAGVTLIGVPGQLATIAARGDDPALPAPRDGAVVAPATDTISGPMTFEAPPAAVASVRPPPAPAPKRRQTDGTADQEHYLAKIFKKAAEQTAAPAARKAQSFEDIFKESMEDQELRRRLEQGLSGKVP